MTFFTIYIGLGFFYSLFLMIESFIGKKRKNREYWIGILIMGTLFWPLDLLISFKEYTDCKVKNNKI